MDGHLAVMAAKLAQLEAVGGILGVFRGRIVTVVALGALQRKKGTVSLWHDVDTSLSFH
jgi:hypothetical protein